MTPEDKDKEIKRKMDAFMADVAVDLLTPETLKMVEEKVVSLLKRDSIPASTNTYQAFRTGMEMAVAGMNEGGMHLVMPMCAALAKIIKERQDKMREVMKKNDGNIIP